MSDFGTRPAVIHAQGFHSHKPHWAPLRDAFFATPPSRQVLPPELTLITCNNGHQAMGCFEKSLSHLGLNCTVLGHGIDPWVNSRDKIRVIAASARRISTEYMLYADSRDAILIQPPQAVLQCFLSNFSCGLLFGGDRLSYPPDVQSKRYEESLPGASQSEFKYLNAGAWIGRTSLVAEFFEAACRCHPFPLAPESEQGILRRLLPRFGGRVGIDHRCCIFLNVGFAFRPNLFVQSRALEPNA